MFSMYWVFLFIIMHDQSVYIDRFAYLFVLNGGGLLIILSRDVWVFLLIGVISRVSNSQINYTNELMYCEQANKLVKQI